MTFPFLSVIVFTPAAAGMIILLVPAEKKNIARGIALAAGALDLLLGLIVYVTYLTQHMTGYQFIEQYNWLPMLGISLHFGVDGMSTPLILLTGVVMFTGVLISWGEDHEHVQAGIQDRPREFFAFLFILASGVFGVFASLDLFMLFFFYEIAVFPMYLLIVIWGWVVTREYAAMKLTLYLFLGSVVALVGALAMYWVAGLQTGVYTFDMLQLEKANFSPAFQNTWFLPVFFGFAVLGGIWPFHNWSPDGHVAAPTAVSMFHAGVLMKLGAFAALRVGIMLLPEGAKNWSWLVMLGFSTLSKEGLTGSGVQMFSHGVMTALFFAVVGMVYDRAHTRHMPDLGGMAKVMPWPAVGFIIGSLVSMGMPGFSGFIAEFPIFLGVWKTQWLVAVIASISIIVTAAYVMLVVRRVFFGQMPENFAGHVGPVTVLDKLAIGTLCTFMVGIGLFPTVMVPMVQTGVENILRLLGGA